jgi:hypothetical protein
MPIEDQKLKQTFNPGEKMLDPDQIQKKAARQEKMHTYSITTSYSGKEYTFLVSGKISKDDLLEKLKSGKLSDEDKLKFSVYDKKAKRAYEIDANTLMAHVDLENARISEVAKKSAKKNEPKPEKQTDETRRSTRVAAEEPIDVDVSHGGKPVASESGPVAENPIDVDVSHGGKPVTPETGS